MEMAWTTKVLNEDGPCWPDHLRPITSEIAAVNDHENIETEDTEAPLLLYISSQQLHCSLAAQSC